MNIDAILLGALAIMDMGLIVYLRKRHGRRVRMQRMMTSIRLFVRREIGVEELPVRRRLMRAS